MFLIIKRVFIYDYIIIYLNYEIIKLIILFYYNMIKL